MNNDESNLREAMGRHLDGLQPGTPIEQINQRARRGRLLMATSLVVLVALVGASGAFMLDRVADDEVDRVVGPAPAPHDGLIAFTTQDHGEPMSWIAVVPAAGGEVTRLREGSGPSWSPDGTRIAFGCHPGICTMNADGSNVQTLTTPPKDVVDEDPDWGPGGYVVFTRTYLDFERGPDLFLIRETGGSPTLLIETGSNFGAAWSPDGRAVAFIRGLGPLVEAPRTGFQLWTMASDGTDLRQLTETEASRPDWSPDGQTILFDEASTLWTIPAGGGEPQKLPVVSGQAFDVGSFAAWAPDSRRIAFMCSSTGTDNNDICLSDVDSEEWTALVATGENEASPTWQPPVVAIPSEGQLVTYEDEERGFTISYPSEWMRAETSLTPNLSDPVEIFSVGGGFGFRPGGEACAQFPVNALEDFGQNSVFFTIQEASSTTRFDDRPSDLETLAVDSNSDDLDVINCIAEHERDDIGQLWWIRFKDQGRAFYVLVVFGPQSGAKRQEQLWASLNSFTPRPSDDGQGRISCHDPSGDLASAGSGDQSGPGPQSPDEDRDGTDLTGFSMARHPDGSLEINFSTRGDVPRELASSERIAYVVTAEDPSSMAGFSSLSARLRGDEWTVRARNDDDDSEIAVDVEIAGEVLNLLVPADLVPRVMRGTFRWHAFSEWIPQTTHSSAGVYSDYCPDSGLRRFEGTSS